MSQPIDKRAVYPVFGGLMLGMLVASLNLTLIAPAMPTIVAELGGIQYYSWIPIASLIASTVVVPIVGKLSDIYGRKQFYIAGVACFSIGSMLAGLAPSFWFLVGARVLQGAGMGAVQPMVQAIIGDLVPPRERGKFQGLIGVAFGAAAVMGPPLGGFITEHSSWRVLFFVNVPFAIAALVVVALFMRQPVTRRRHSIDIAGIVTLSAALTAGLMATVWGGSQFPWNSWQVVGLYLAAAIALAVFIWIETRAAEPVIPLALWRSGVFVFSNLANMGVAMAMFGAIYFIPVFVQGVLGSTAGGSGYVLVPMLFAMIVLSIVNGQLISRTGRYKPQLIAGLVSMGIGFWLLTRMDGHTPNADVVRNMILIGIGLGIGMQTYTLVVQNSVSRDIMGTATSATQLFRSIGSAIGIAVMGSILTSSLIAAIPRHLDPASLAQLRRSGHSAGSSAATVLDPNALAQLPPALAAGIRASLSDALHNVFLAGLPFLALALVASLLIRELPLRTSHAPVAEEAGKELLAELGNEAAPEPIRGPIAEGSR